MLFSHIALAILMLPCILRLLWLVKHARFEEHKRLARFVFPVWTYVSATGLLVYLLLYQIYGYACHPPRAHQSPRHNRTGFPRGNTPVWRSSFAAQTSFCENSKQQFNSSNVASHDAHT